MPRPERAPVQEMKSNESASRTNNQEEDVGLKSRKVCFGEDGSAKVNAPNESENRFGEDKYTSALEKILEEKNDPQVEAKKSELRRIQKDLKNNRAKLENLRLDKSSIQDKLRKMREDTSADSPDADLIDGHKTSVETCCKLIQGVLSKQDLIAKAQSDTLTKLEQKLAVKSSLDGQVLCAYQCVQNGLSADLNHLKLAASHFLDSKKMALDKNLQERERRCSQLQGRCREEN